MKGSQNYIGHTYTKNFSLPLRSLADHLLDRFWEKVYYLYPVFNRTTFEHAYRNLWEDQEQQNNSAISFNIGLGSGSDGGAHTPLYHCALNIMFAVGVSFSDIPIAAIPSD